MFGILGSAVKSITVLSNGLNEQAGLSCTFLWFIFHPAQKLVLPARGAFLRTVLPRFPFPPTILSGRVLSSDERLR